MILSLKSNSVVQQTDGCACFHAIDVETCRLGFFVADAYNIPCTHVCEDTLGSYRCSCLDGYQLDADGYTCSPLVSCDSNNGCQQDCVRIAGQQLYYKPCGDLLMQ